MRKGFNTKLIPVVGSSAACPGVSIVTSSPEGSGTSEIFLSGLTGKEVVGDDWRGVWEGPLLEGWGVRPGVPGGGGRPPGR